MEAKLNVSIHRYELVSAQTPAKHRDGILFRYRFSRDAFGYADCHPWPEFGDLPLQEQLAAYFTPQGSPLLVETFGFALHDLWDRQASKSLFDGLEIPPSHASLHDAFLDPQHTAIELSRLAVDGFKIVKVKAGSGRGDEAAAMVELASVLRSLGMKMRLDLNARFGLDQVTQLLEVASSKTDGLDWLDWVEDPCPFDKESWKELRKRFRIRVAVDLAADPLVADLEGAADVIVLKPAVQDRRKVFKRASDLNLPVCVTSYLDHPVGQAFAAWTAAEAAAKGAKLEPCGLLTHNLYQPTEFSGRLGSRGPYLIPPAGTGIGFDDLLENLLWTNIPGS